jgi:hypothetical protein
MAVIFAGLAGGFCLLEVLCWSNRRRFAAWSCMGGLVCTGLINLLFASTVCKASSSCRLGKNGIYNVVSFGLYLVAAFLICTSAATTPLFRQVRMAEKKRKDNTQTDDDTLFGKAYG